MRPPYQTASNDSRYRSAGEIQIARCLNRYHVPHLYEQPIAVVDRGQTRIWYPDFQLRDYGILIEYCGRTHDQDYANGIARKEKVYQANGLTAIMLHPEIFHGDWPHTILDRIEGVLDERLQRFRNQRNTDMPRTRVPFLSDK